MAKAPKRKSWAEKMDHPVAPEVKKPEKGFAGIPMGSRMLIPTPRLLEAYLKQSTPGYKINLRQMRADLAAEYGADFTCPLTTGIFLRILTEYTNEKREAGTPESQLAPVWRVVDPKIPLWKKLTFDKQWLEKAWINETI